MNVEKFTFIKGYIYSYVKQKSICECVSQLFGIKEYTRERYLPGIRSAF